MSNNKKGLGSTLKTRPTLLFRIRESEDGASWEEFHRLYWRLIHGRALRAGLSHVDAEEVAQDVFKRVAETIGGFYHDPNRGSFRGWLMKLTHWRIADKYARRPKLEQQTPLRRDESPERTSTIDRIPSPTAEEDEWDVEWQRHILAAAVERLTRRVKPRHFQVFDLYVRQQWPVLRVAVELGINPASVYLIAHRLTRQLRAEAKKLQEQIG
jgi:RNA polymerase sigma-70 factor (ECF subfamily)